ncbi:MAG: hypothetical protein ACKOW3_00695, partial [Hyphomicrobium sp.]
MNKLFKALFRRSDGMERFQPIIGQSFLSFTISLVLLFLFVCKLQTLAFAQGVALSHDSLWRSIFQRPTTNINDEKNAEKAKRLL